MNLNISLSPEILFKIGSFPVTNSFIWMIVASLILMIITLIIRYKFKQVPGRLQAAMEILVEGGLDLMQSILGGNKKLAKKSFPLVFTLFSFILISNLLTFLPGSALVFNNNGEKIPFFRAVMSDYGMVLVLTLISVITVQIIAIFSFGPFNYIGKFFNLSGIFNFFKEIKNGKIKLGLLGQGFLDLFLGLMDVVGELAKVISLSFRLFGNIFAGEVLGSVILSLFPWILPLPFQFLGLLSAVIQSFVFSMLTLVFISLAIDMEKVREMEGFEN